MAKSSLHHLRKEEKSAEKLRSSKKALKEAAALKSKPKTKLKDLKEAIPQTTPKPYKEVNSKVVLDQELLIKAIEALKAKSALKAQGRPKDLLEDSFGKSVYLQFSLKKLPTEVHVKPLAVALSNPIYKGKDVCLFVKDPQSRWKDIVRGLDIAEIKKVIGVKKLKAKYKTFEDRRLLCSSYDLFLCDRAVAPSLPSLLGKVFMSKKK